MTSPEDKEKHSFRRKKNGLAKAVTDRNGVFIEKKHEKSEKTKKITTKNYEEFYDD